MPISAENRARYPKDWRTISLEVRERAGWVCEGSPAFPDCRAANGKAHPVTGSMVVLTVAHLNHLPEDCGEPGARPNLKAWCQRCHLTYDAKHHSANAGRTLRSKRASGDLFESEAR